MSGVSAIKKSVQVIIIHECLLVFISTLYNTYLTKLTYTGNVGIYLVTNGGSDNVLIWGELNK